MKLYLKEKYTNNVATTVSIDDAVLDLKEDKKIAGKMKITNPISTCKKLYLWSKEYIINPDTNKPMITPVRVLFI